MTFIVKKLFAALILPPVGPILLIAIALMIMNSRPRLARVMGWSMLAILMAMCWPPVSTGLTQLSFDGRLLDPENIRGAQAIVIMGGGIRGRALEYGADAPTTLTLERLRYGAFVAKKTHLPVLVTGGSLRGFDAEANVMRRILEEEFNVPVRWIESQSRDTHQNAINSAKLLQQDDIRRVILVTHAVDSVRAIREFSGAGLEVIPAPTVVPTSSLIDSDWDWVPSMSAFNGSYWALYELSANLALSLGLNR